MRYPSLRAVGPATPRIVASARDGPAARCVAAGPGRAAVQPVAQTAERRSPNVFGGGRAATWIFAAAARRRRSTATPMKARRSENVAAGSATASS